MEDNQKQNSDRLKRLVNIEIEVGHIQSTTKYLAQKKWEIDQQIQKEIQPLKMLRV